MVQEGNLGLLAAIERFDPEMGVRLPTYAAWWIRAYIVKFLLDNVRLVRVGTTNARRKLLRNLRQEKSRLAALGFDAGLIRRYVDLTREAVFYLDPHICRRCRYRTTELLWQCPQCHEWNTFVEEHMAPAKEATAAAQLES